VTDEICILYRAKAATPATATVNSKPAAFAAALLTYVGDGTVPVVTPVPEVELVVTLPPAVG